MASHKHFYLLIALMAIGLEVGQAQAGSTEDSNESCQALQTRNFSRLLDASTKVTESKWVGQEGTSSAYCQVRGVVAPSVGFVLRLPTGRWNGKFIELGCGGFCGYTDDGADCQESVNRGYACLISDNGHQGGAGDSSFTRSLSNKWAYNNLPAEIDHAYRAAHVASIAGKAIIESYYHQFPKLSYFWGCSTGGRLALMEAQRFPWDFNGIVAACPSVNVPSIHMTYLWNNRAFVDPSTQQPRLTRRDIELLHKAVIARCDMNDGAKDGLIGDPRVCTFDPSELQCVAAKTPDCLTDEQVGAVRKIYAGPTTTRGEPIYMPSAMKGSELTWTGWFNLPELVAWATAEFQYSAFQPNPGPTWKLEDFNFDRDYQRLGVAEGLYAAVNPDLRRFKAAGGKLLSYAGWNDALGMPLPAVDYYESVERTMSGRANTQDFFRLFMVPGMEHCVGGDGATVVDWLSALERWVEKGEPPQRLLAAHPRILKQDGQGQGYNTSFPLDEREIVFSRPLYPYPVGTKYLGRGNLNSAASFGPSGP